LSVLRAGGFGRSVLPFRRQFGHLRRDLCTRPGAHQTIDDDRLGAVKALAYDAVAIETRSGSHGLGRHRAVFGDDIDDALILVRADGLVGDENGLVGVGGFDLYATEEAGLKDEIGVGEAGTQTNGAALIVDPVLSEIELSLEWFGSGIAVSAKFSRRRSSTSK
jgi:hypothetical protein